MHPRHTLQKLSLCPPPSPPLVAELHGPSNWAFARERDIIAQNNRQSLQLTTTLEMIQHPIVLSHAVFHTPEIPVELRKHSKTHYTLCI